MDREKTLGNFLESEIRVHLPEARSTGLLFLSTIKHIRRSARAISFTMAFSKNDKQRRTEPYVLRKVDSTIKKENRDAPVNCHGRTLLCLLN
jgi:hypothetical protein